MLITATIASTFPFTLGVFLYFQRTTRLGFFPWMAFAVGTALGAPLWLTPFFKLGVVTWWISGPLALLTLAGVICAGYWFTMVIDKAIILMRVMMTGDPGRSWT